VRTVETRNVIGRIEGSDAKLKEEVVAFSAHWDHLGVGEPVNGDRIYNGALDNASGCGMLLEIARAWAALPQKPRRSVIFLAAAAEEAGLRGSYYYGQNPAVPAGKTAVGLNFDMFLPYGRARDVTVNADRGDEPDALLVAAAHLGTEHARRDHGRVTRGVDAVEGERVATGDDHERVRPGLHVELGNHVVMRPFASVLAEPGEIDIRPYAQTEDRVRREGLVLGRAARIVRSGREAGRLAGADVAVGTGDLEGVIGRRSWWTRRFTIPAKAIDLSVPGEVRTPGSGSRAA